MYELEVTKKGKHIVTEYAKDAEGEEVSKSAVLNNEEEYDSWLSAITAQLSVQIQDLIKRKEDLLGLAKPTAQSS